MGKVVSLDVLVVGGGAAGIFAARRTAECGARVTLLEKNPRLGMKILISGGGKCNLTHAGPMEELRAKFRANEARFLKPSFYKFTNSDFLEILHRRGMQTYTRPDGRIFPVEPSNAKDVVALLTKYVEEIGVKIRMETPVTGLCVENETVIGVQIGENILTANRVIVSVGGSSYPATGTTGDGWKWLAAHHEIVPLRAALAPIYLTNPNAEWSGIALRDAVLRARVHKDGKEFARWPGDVLLTHKGVSGPTALGISRDVAERPAASLPVLEADFLPSYSFEDALADLRREFSASPRRTVAAALAARVPSRLVEKILADIGLENQTRGAQLSSKSLNKLAATLKNWTLGDVRHIPLERGEVVAGGVSLDEVNAQTMESKRVSNLYLCGEILDIAGPVGGYNLQAAWSTGWVAGENAGRPTD